MRRTIVVHGYFGPIDDGDAATRVITCRIRYDRELSFWSKLMQKVPFPRILRLRGRSHNTSVDNFDDIKERFCLKVNFHGSSKFPGYIDNRVRYVVLH